MNPSIPMTVISESLWVERKHDKLNKLDFRSNMEISQNIEDVPEIKLDLVNIKKEIYMVLKVGARRAFRKNQDTHKDARAYEKHLGPYQTDSFSFSSLSFSLLPFLSILSFC